MNMVDLSFTLNQGWYLTLLSSSLCVLGCFVIFFDDIYTFVFPKSVTKKYNFHLKENYLFLNGALAFSSGCLLFTALFKLLPEALEYFNDFNEHDRAETDKMQKKELNSYLIISFISGILLCFLFNAVLHLITSQSVVHCNHGGEQHLHSHSHGNDLELGHGESVYNETLSSNEREDNHSHTHANTGDDTEADIETTPLLDEHKPLMKKRPSLIHYFMAHDGDEMSLGECKGYSSAEMCLFNKNKPSELHFARSQHSPNRQILMTMNYTLYILLCHTSLVVQAIPTRITPNMRIHSRTMHICKVKTIALTSLTITTT